MENQNENPPLMETDEFKELVALAMADFPHIDKWVCETMVLAYMEGKLSEEEEAAAAAAAADKYGLRSECKPQHGCGLRATVTGIVETTEKTADAPAS